MTGDELTYFTKTLNANTKAVDELKMSMDKMAAVQASTLAFIVRMQGIQEAYYVAKAEKEGLVLMVDPIVQEYDQMADDIQEDTLAQEPKVIPGSDAHLKSFMGDRFDEYKED